MKKCKGCGAILQNDNPKEVGYVKKIEQDYCQRCFRLKHYNDLVIDMKNEISRDDVLKEIDKLDVLLILVIDILNIESALTDDILNVISNKKVVLILNKYDVLPKNTNIEKVLKYIEKLTYDKMQGFNIKDVLLTQKNDPNFNIIFKQTLDSLKVKRCAFIGNVNAGKSTIINKLIDRDDLTVSRYPSTTIGFNEIIVDDYTYIDTPGLIDDSSMVMRVNQDELKKVLITNTIKPIVYQLYEPQSYFVEGLLRIDIVNKTKNASVIFYMNPLLNIHRTKMINGDKYEEKHLHEFILKWQEKETKKIKINNSKQDIIINGLGIISLNNIEEIIISTQKGIGINERETVI